MRKLAIILGLLIGQLVQAQNTEFVNYFKNKKAKLIMANITSVLPNSNSALAKQNTDLSQLAKQYLLDNLTELKLSNVDLELIHTYQSLVGTHYQFTQTYLGTKVYQANVKIAVNSYGQVINIVNDLVDLHNINLPTSAISTNQIWAFNGAKLVVVNKQIVGNKEQYFDINNQLLFENIKSLKAGKDTNALVKIFNPDPLTTARSQYVAPYLNYNKQDTPALNNERKSLLLNLKIDENGNFLAENDYVLVKDIMGPIAEPFSVGKKDSLIVTRNTDIFKQEMALYHINQYQKYIQSLGFTNLKNQLWVDPLGDFGEDSRFEFSTENPYILLGIGGIPDAEDADVITHEYSHAVAFYIAPNTIDGEERIGIDEGNADIMAVLYSRKLSDYNWRKVFNWDGNESWNGRNTLNTKNYLNDFVLQRYSLGNIWSGAVTDIAEEIGIDTTVTLLLTAMASLQTNMTIPQFANLFIQADSILFNKYHYGSIKNSFVNRKIINGLSAEELLNGNFIKITNTIGFAQDNELLTIQIPSSQKYKVSVTDIQGKEIMFFDNQFESTNISPIGFNRGLYILNISIGNKNFNYKIIKY
ncbi:MAG: T9SS type A sorting domain-containing protein [Bacteroidia bacterium]